MNETEIKLAVDAITRNDILANWNLQSNSDREILQRDEYFDHSDRTLSIQDLTVRIRSVGDIVQVALKGPRTISSDNISRRIELEFVVSDAIALRKQIDSQDLHPTFIVEKRRTEFPFHDCKVAVDTLPFIGSYIEIEGISELAIRSVMSEIGLLDKLSVKENYSELLKAFFRENGLETDPCLNATFESERIWLHERLQN